MAAVETETVPSEWCGTGGGVGVWQQWKQKPSLQSVVGQVMELGYGSSGNRNRPFRVVSDDVGGGGGGGGSNGNRNCPFRAVSDDGVGGYGSSGNKPSLQGGVGQMMELGYGSSGNRNRPFRVVSDDGVGWGVGGGSSGNRNRVRGGCGLMYLCLLCCVKLGFMKC